MFDRIYRTIGLEEKYKPVVEFPVKIVLIYAFWKLFHYTVTHHPALQPQWEHFTNNMAAFIAGTCHSILATFFGYELTSYYPRAVYILETPGLLVAEHCLAIPATLIFGAFIWFYHGPLRHKLWYIPLGMLAVQLINIVRITGLAMILKHYPPRYYDFNHSYTMVIMTYGLIFLMVMFWMRRYYWMDSKRTLSV